MAPAPVRLPGRSRPIPPAIAGDGSLVLEIEAPAEGGVGVSTWLHAWTDIRTGYVIGQQGGHQGHLRLADGQQHYVLFAGEDGLLVDRPGRTYAGVALSDDGGLENAVHVASCEASDTNRALLENVRRARIAAKAPPLAEEELGGRFDGWF